MIREPSLAPSGTARLYPTGVERLTSRGGPEPERPPKTSASDTMIDLFERQYRTAFVVVAVLVLGDQLLVQPYLARPATLIKGASVASGCSASGW